MNCQRCTDPVDDGQTMCDHCLMMAHTHSLLTARPGAPSLRNRRTGNRGGYRHQSEALAVDPEDVAGQREHFKQHGVGDIEHTPDGCPIFTSCEQFQKANKALGRKTGRDGYEIPGLESGRIMARKKQEVIAKWEKLGAQY